jgi:hypothetical protein
VGTLKRGLTLAVGNRGHIQKEIRSAWSRLACGLFTGQLQTKQPDQPRSWT